MGMEPQTLLFDALIPSLEEVGARFERGDFFVPEMLIAGRAMAGAMEVLRPLLAETGVQTIGKFLMGTVKGDVHDIGKNLVNIMLEGAGFEVIDLGVQVAPEKFVETIEEHQPDIVGFSAFLTTTMPMFKANINALQKAGLRDQVIVMVGGAPVTQEYADAVGADGYAADASQTVKRAKDLLHKRRTPVAGMTRARSHEAAPARRARREDAGLRLPHVRAVRPALHRHDLPDDLPQDAAQRPVRRRPRGRHLRGRPVDALRVAQGVPALAPACRCCRAPGARSSTTCGRPSTTGCAATSSWVNLVTGRDRQTPAGWAAAAAPVLARLVYFVSRFYALFATPGRDHRHRRDAPVRRRRLRRVQRHLDRLAAARRRDQRHRQRRRARAPRPTSRWRSRGPARRRADHAGRLPRQEPARAAVRHRRRELFGVENICCLTGDYVTAGDEPGAAARVRPRRPQLSGSLSTLASGHVPVRASRSTRRRTCSSAPSRTPPRRRSPTAPRAGKKLHAGARFFQLQICFHPDRLDAFMAEAVAAGRSPPGGDPAHHLPLPPRARSALHARARPRHRRARGTAARSTPPADPPEEALQVALEQARHALARRASAACTSPTSATTTPSAVSSTISASPRPATLGTRHDPTRSSMHTVLRSPSRRS